MNAILRGYKALDFQSDGQQVKGTQLFVSFSEDGVEGEMCDRLFVRSDISLPALKPGMTLAISYNRKGKAERIEAVTTKQLNLGSNQ